MISLNSGPIFVPAGDKMHSRHLTTRIAALLAAFTLVFALAGPPPARAAGKIQIMTATSDLAALAQEVGGDKVDAESIARGYQDPHFVDAKPSFLLKLKRADLLIVVGLELEIGWLPPLITQSTNPKIQVGGPGYFDVPTYLGMSLEIGNVWQSRSQARFNNTEKDASIFLGLDTFLGPVYLASGFDTHGNQAFYLFLGRTF